MKYLNLAVLIIALGVIAPRGECLRPSPEAKTPEATSSKVNDELTQMLRERDLSKREADKRIREKEKVEEERADTVQVRVHSGGLDPVSRKENKVIMTAQISKEDLKSKNFKEIHRRSMESRKAYAQSQGQSQNKSDRARLSDGEATVDSENGNAGLLMMGALGLGGLWYVRQQNLV